MPSKPAANAVLISAAFLFLTGIALAMVELDEFHYEHPIRAIRGRVRGFGQVVPGFWVDVYDKARVPLDDSMPEFEKRKEQARVASVEPDEKGEFNIQHLPKGPYEVRFGNRGQGGYNTVAVLVNVDPRGTKDRLCVAVGLEGSGPRSSVSKCGSTTHGETELKFCELLRNPKLYDGQLVKVRATLHYGFDWSDLYCLDCRNKGLACLDPSGDPIILMNWKKRGRECRTGLGSLMSLSSVSSIMGPPTTI